MPQNNKVRKVVYLDAETVAWFSDRYPGASLNEMLNGFLKQFKIISTLDFVDLQRIGAKELKEMIE